MASFPKVCYLLVFTFTLQTQQWSECTCMRLPTHTHTHTHHSHSLLIPLSLLFAIQLQTGLDVNVRYDSVKGFEFTSEIVIFDLLNVPLYHGWLPDPQVHTVHTTYIVHTHISITYVYTCIYV